MATQDEAKVYYDAKVIGIELPDGTFQPLRVGRRGRPIRTWDSLIVHRLGSGEIVRAEPVQLSPKPTVQTGGVDSGLRRREGKLLVVVTDPLDHKVCTLRVNPRVVAETKSADQVGAGSISGTWRAFSVTGNGLLIEAHPGMEVAIIERPRGVDITGTLAAGDAIRVSDASYAADSRLLSFWYHLESPLGGELSAWVTVTRSGDRIFEGEEIGGWVGATARPFTLRWHRL